MKPRMKTVRVSARLWAEIERRVVAGEFPTVAEAVAVAVRYYLERHSADAWDRYVGEESDAGVGPPPSGSETKG